ncbi:hypothetical protein H2199_004850 [Coniosporium tulheliwenetii]|uniref:Uncharacterized protein n=1 Tax=Coniosporium tulheliwenetii TaxID=3383036 RepID=A0ACC2Z551_9PEZI|nr:hypothetical protein H2199_004850 [Cladosporium sp. JES 115]
MVDALEFLAKQYNEMKDERTEAGLDALLSTFHELLEGVHEFRLTVSQNLISRLLFVCSAEQATKLHEALLEKEVVLNWQNCLRFAVSFGKRGDYLHGLDMLQQAIDVGADVNCGPFLETCTTVLRFSIKQENGYQANTQIVSRFLEMGVKLSIHHYSSLMFNAVEAGDFSTVLRIFDLLQENNVEPNSFIYWALLKGCMAQSNSEAASRVLRSCSHKIREFKNPYLTTNLLYCFYLQLVARSTPSLFATLVDIYRSLFSGDPLVDLDLLSAHYFAAPSPHASAIIPPTTPALGLMILASLRHAEKPSPHATYRLYLSYRRLVKAGHAAIAPLAETDYTSNAFLMAFAQSAESLSCCPQVIKDMTIALPPAAIHVAEQRPINQATPTTQTWTILLNGFMRHRQTRAAEKVLQLMRKRGAEPNVVTWNSLVAGYAGAQDVEGAVGALKRMEGEGVQVDGYTVAALGHLRDRERVAKALGVGEGLAEEPLGKSAVLAEGEEEVVEPGTTELEHEVYLAPATA